MFVDVLDDSTSHTSILYSLNLPAQEHSPFVHQKNMWSARHIWVNRHGKYELVVFSVEIIEMILKQVSFSRAHITDGHDFVLPSKCLRYRVGLPIHDCLQSF